ncbi:carboxypeptidase-like regulatory domain-containing protein [Salinadaptatus halalkaliphilus]|uniref:carboxypeptidase-like regulatory domain-containing protein n=1 Tax=Salinadaptatus halalkaliphilus TaxID=2419781 RepID=UPI001FECD7C5|nr:carboxypeptidase-like regulatory domain-containing protein [Salinadaptatus halalkaliphilus]
MTDENGEFEFDGNAVGSEEITVEILIDQEPVYESPETFEPEPGDDLGVFDISTAITGQIVDEHENEDERVPVPNATVLAVDDDGQIIDTALTDETGLFEFDEEDVAETLITVEVNIGPNKRFDSEPQAYYPEAGDHLGTFAVEMSDPELLEPEPDGDYSVPAIGQGTELEVTVADDDFPTSEVFVEFYAVSNGDYIPIGNETVHLDAPDSERVSTTWPAANEQGVYEWAAVAGDMYNSTAIAETGTLTFEIDSDAPIIRGATASPDDEVVTGDVDLEVDVEHHGFPEDGVTVEFYEYDSGDPEVDELIGSDTLESNDTARTPWAVDGETLEWYVVAESDAGHVVFSDIFSFGMAGDLEVRDAVTGELVDDRSVEIDVTAPDESFTTEVSDGIFDISQLDSQDETVRFEISAMDYYPRTVELRSTVGGETVFLERGPDWEADPPDDEDDPDDTPDHEDDEDTVLVRFELNDRTGDFDPDETLLRVTEQVDNESQLAHSETFGSINRVDVTLTRDDRYDLEIESDDGGVRGMGGFTASESEVVELDVGDLSWPVPREEGYEFDARLSEDGNLEIRWIDEDELTRPLEITVTDYEEGYTVHRDYEASLIGHYAETVNVSDDRTYEVTAEATRDGETVELTQIVGPTDMDVEPPLGEKTMAAISAVAVVVVAGIVGGALSGIGAVLVAIFAGLLAVMGWLPVPWSAIVVALVVSVMFYVGDTT